MESNQGYAGITEIKNETVYFKAIGGIDFLEALQRILRKIYFKLGNIYALGGYDVGISFSDSLTQEQYTAQITGNIEDIKSELKNSTSVLWYSDKLLEAVKCK